MNSSATPRTARPTIEQSRASDTVTFGAVHLDVRDLDQSLAFWRDALGLAELDRDAASVTLGSDTTPLVVLHAGATAPQQRGHSGLYHLALHVPTETAFANTLVRLARARVPQSPTDHIMHWATYATDPDGIGLEVSFETLDRFGGYEMAGGRFGVRDSDGQLRAGTGALDVDEVLAHAEEDPGSVIADGTRIGHLHLHVADLATAQNWYVDTLGFVPNADLSEHGFLDMSAAGSFPHRLALNVWQGAGAPPQPAGAAGMRSYELNVRDEAQRSTLFAGAEDGLLRDPAGNAVRLLPA